MSDNVYFDPQWFENLTDFTDGWMPDVALIEGEVGNLQKEPHSFPAPIFTEPGNFNTLLGWPPADYSTAHAFGRPLHDPSYTSATVPCIHSEAQVTNSDELPSTGPVITSFPPFDPLEACTLATTSDIDPHCKITFPTDSGTSAASLPALFSYGVNGGSDNGILARSIAEGPMMPLPTSSGSLSSMTATEGSSESLPPAELTTLVSPTSTSSISARGMGVSDDRKPSEGFPCTQQGCRSKTIFKRKYELERHIKSVHEKATKFACPVISCYKKGSESLTRPDKFREHLRVSHVYDDLSQCPDSSCSVVLPLLLLQLHVKNHSRLEVEHMRAVGGYMEVSHRVRGCPMEGCRKSLPAQDLQLHLGTAHTEEQRETNRVAITTGGFDHERCTIICPVCKIQSPSFDEAHEHVLRFHTVLDYDHYDAVWSVAQHVLETNKKNEYSHNNIEVVNEVPSHISCTRSCGSNCGSVRQERCPVCSAFIFKMEGCKKFSITHTLDLLRPADSLFEHRLCLLKLFPSFEKHPVFAPDWPMDNGFRQEKIERHFSSDWISNRYELVYGPATGTGSRSTKADMS